ncbi:hypothetical protein QYE76_031021 [Lolium multiflorum]|uniref:Uncharacterized protein n=1 Tax=Lolium multiflorum TaxID=4521 RepID=A0AAD8QUF3_LOLMU|nr:hypothetical protein QYE76_031021 [Lolium multiflorum]
MGASPLAAPSLARGGAAAAAPSPPDLPPAFPFWPHASPPRQPLLSTRTRAPGVSSRPFRLDLCRRLSPGGANGLMEVWPLRRPPPPPRSSWRRGPVLLRGTRPLERRRCGMAHRRRRLSDVEPRWFPPRRPQRRRTTAGHASLVVVAPERTVDQLRRRCSGSGVGGSEEKFEKVDAMFKAALFSILGDNIVDPYMTFDHGKDRGMRSAKFGVSDAGTELYVMEQYYDYEDD